VRTAIRKKNTDWRVVDDDFLMRWRNEQEIKGGLKKRTINERLSTVFHYYWWAQDQGYVRNVIASPANSGDNSSAQISISIGYFNSKGSSRGARRFSSPLLYRTIREPNLHTPTAEETTRVHAVLADNGEKRLVERNTLMLSWAEEAGLRRKEFGALRVSQIPNWDEIDRLMNKDIPYLLDLTITKGDKQRTIAVVPDLLIRTRDYIEEDRARTISTFRKRLRNSYKTPDEVFISTKSGTSLCLGAISNLFARAFKEAKVRGSAHRMRARYLTSLVEHYYEEAMEKHGSQVSYEVVLLKAAEAAGHNHPSSLRPYLNLVRKRHLTGHNGKDSFHSEQRALSTKRHLQINLHKLKTISILCEFAEAWESGESGRIRKSWKEVQSVVEQMLIGNIDPKTK
jgi:integrase